MWISISNSQLVRLAAEALPYNKMFRPKGGTLINLWTFAKRYLIMIATHSWIKTRFIASLQDGLSVA
ncbi:hypothetical protein CEN44_07300 [Fischerella muscicola CCMEE 5323]|uniref:Uncharacterized protein n=1 Tax=Fischerella muscicola CCMEE 5323 TaxID=2019572 RepID=A0A2N6K5M8_FISMU|nr:hypothetical protein CEN44_07300 [Fischerella muscicola CCMEE 5323]